MSYDSEDRNTKTVVLDKVKNTRISVSVALLIMMLIGTYWGGIEANRQYVDWHDGRYAKKSEVLTLAQADKIEAQIGVALDESEKNGEKLDMVADQLDGLKISSAITAVASLRQELERHERYPENTELWEKERSRLTAQITTAIEYRDCLIEGRHNCDLYRGW